MESPDHANHNQTQRRRRFRCPACKRIVRLPEQDRSEQTRFYPFCSERCKLIDLGAWLDAEYRIPSRPDEESEKPLQYPVDVLHSIGLGQMADDVDAWRKLQQGIAPLKSRK